MGCGSLDARRRVCSQVVVCVGAALVLGCTQAGTTYDAEDGGPPATTVPDGTTVGSLAVEAPTLEEFVLRGTLPVPAGTFPRPDLRRPFTVRAPDGTEFVTQTELVTRYPSDAAGADVVEVIARVRRDPSLLPGTRLAFEVVQKPGAPRASLGTPGVEDLLDATLDLPQPVRSFLNDPGSLRIRTFDVFGNEYVSLPLDGSGTAELLRAGPVHTELRVHQVMAAVAPDPGPQGTLPHFFGVHAYISTLRGEEVIGLDLRFHNAHSGLDTGSPWDDPLDKVYFQRIEVELPSSWTLLQDVEDPFFGPGLIVGDRKVHALVEPNPDGTPHVLRWQGQFHRRLMIATPAGWTAADAYLRAAGQAFCEPGFDAASGLELWSWWNRGTSRYFPQSYELPDLAHVPGLTAGLQATHDWLIGHLRNGTGEGAYPLSSGILGWGHPYGVPYGGMTSGQEIFLFDGLPTAWVASAAGFRTYRAMHRMHTDRMPSALYDIDGVPSSVERWLRPGPNGPYVPFGHFLLPTIEADDPFGLAAAPRFQIEHVEGTGLQPAYEADHLAFDAHDFQHFIRYTRSAKVLQWLGNDSLAKDDLLMQAENFHLSYHEYANTSFGGFQASGMRADLEFVAQYPATGFPFGRGEAWGLDCAVAAFASADPAWRARKRAWLRRIGVLVGEGQAACSGSVQANVSSRFANGKYRTRQAYEQAITENALRGLRETVLRGDDPAGSSLVRDTLIRAHYGGISPLAWFPGQPGPWTLTAVGWAAPGSNFCSLLAIPSDGWSPEYERYQNWSSFAYGYELSGDPLFLDKARQLIGGDLFSLLEQAGLGNIENRAALLALCQRLAGMP